MTLPPVLMTVVRTWAFLFEQERHRVLWSLGAATSGAYAGTSAWLAKCIVDSVATGAAGGGGAGAAFAFVGVFGAVTVANAVAAASTTQRMLALRDRVLVRADCLLMARVSSVPGIDGFERTEERDALRLASAGARALPLCVSGSVEVVQHLVTALVVASIVGSFHPALVLAICVPAIPLFYSQMRLSADSYAALANSSPTYRRMAYALELMLGTGAAKEIRIFRNAGFIRRKYEQAADEIFAVSRARRRRAAGAVLGWGSIASLGVGSAYVYVIYLAHERAISIGDVAMYTGAVFYASGAIRGLIQSSAALTTSALEAGAFFHYMAASVALETLRANRDDATAWSVGRASWRVRDVSYVYPGQAIPALKNVTFDIAAGERVAVVGLNGAGKSTLVKILLGLLDPAEGEVSFAGRPLREWEPAALWRRCAVLFQDFVKFRLTLRESILPGATTGRNGEDSEVVRRAAAWAGLDEIASASREGYNVLLGGEFAEGRELSEGLWHRVALARAYARDADALILDEPTASLDAKAEQALLERVLSCSAAKTTLIISHRMGVTPLVDRVLVFDRGSLVEEGRHSDLMKRDGLYARLYRTQAEMYWAPAPSAEALAITP